jgi:sugar O-acyltransferase (sialic acid O-acetyltransferase NeuD family)
LKNKVIIFGTGQFAELAHYYLTHDSNYEVCGFTIDKDYIKNPTFKDLPVIPFDEIEIHFPPANYNLFIPISFININKIRKEKYLIGKEKGYNFISYVSSKATVFNTEIGENCFILENNTIQPFSKIGNNIIMWSGNHFGHHSEIKDHCFMASHIVVSGAVTIDEETFIGVNSTFRDNVKVGKSCVIGAGSLVLKDLPDYSVMSPHQTEISKVPSTRLRKI